MKEIIIYTDGSCLHNPGRGGWAAVIMDGEERTEISGGALLSTNNRMEIRAAIEALRALSRSHSTRQRVVIHTDSQLLVNSIMKGWAQKWRANNWKRNRTDKAENPDLWAILLDELQKHDVRFEWTKGHAGTVENERCDVLAKAAAERASEHDEVYERHVGRAVATPTAVQKNATPTLFDAEEQAPTLPKGAMKGYIVTTNHAASTIQIEHATNGRLTIEFQELPGVLAAIKHALAK